uniref:phosphoribosylformylglycinamidine synthase subunit PurS n=1 Tax=Staphylococcus epidermidis TaxID=1282 RepID=UPI0011A6A41E
VLHTQGQPLNPPLHHLPYQQLNHIPLRKLLYITLNQPTHHALDNIITTLSQNLFPNTLIQQYTYKLIHQKDKP